MRKLHLFITISMILLTSFLTLYEFETYIGIFFDKLSWSMILLT